MKQKISYNFPEVMATKKGTFSVVVRYPDTIKKGANKGKTFIPAARMITHGFHNSFWYEIDKFDYRYLYAMDFEKLLEWHFDVFGLIDAGLAIDINTLK